MFGEVCEQSAELWSFLDGLRGLAGLDELLDDGDVHVGGFAVAFLTLGRDGVAVAVNICGSVGLPD
nr:hypothetical protein [Flexivirga caeni]